LSSLGLLKHVSSLDNLRVFGNRLPFETITPISHTPTASVGVYTCWLYWWYKGLSLLLQVGFPKGMGRASYSATDSYARKNPRLSILAPRPVLDDDDEAAGQPLVLISPRPYSDTASDGVHL
jgi:hypothetical protein